VSFGSSGCSLNIIEVSISVKMIRERASTLSHTFTALAGFVTAGEISSSDIMKKTIVQDIGSRHGHQIHIQIQGEY
jgi:hypothetical protein